MRNVFDQYEQPENRLTHALATTLREEPDLLRELVLHVTGRRIGKRKQLSIVEQSLPGQELFETEDEQSGLPDIWIHDDDTWCLLVESKVSDSLKPSQLQRHYRTAERRGFTEITVLAIEAKALKVELPQFATHTTWSEIYSWLISHVDHHPWAQRASEYFEIAEQKFVQKGYLKEGKLTVFAGIPFGRKHPYNYPEAKRLLGLLMDELRQEERLAIELGLDLSAAGRSAIKGTHGTAVWDFLSFKKAKKAETFNTYPHFTVVISHNQVRAALMIPDKLNRPMRRKLEDLSYEDFCDITGEIVALSRKLQRKESGCQPRMSVTQRHFPVRNKAVIDGQVEFDLRTAFPAEGEKIKRQDEWIASAWESIVNKNSNLEVSIGVAFPYEQCKNLNSKSTIQLMSDAWLACKPISDFLMHGK
jgi:hypothetical protein